MRQLHSNIYHRIDRDPKQTPQTGKTVGQKPTAADKNSNTITTDGNHKGHSATNDKVDIKRQTTNIYNTNIRNHNDILNTTTLTHPQNINIIRTMSAPDPPSGRDRVDDESSDLNEEATNNSAARLGQRSHNSYIAKDRHKPHQTKMNSP